MLQYKKNLYKNKSLLGSIWILKEIEERLILLSSQKNQISPFLARLLLIRNINEDSVNSFLNPDIKNNVPNPFILKDMQKGVNRIILALKNKEKIGIISDYDVDGSTSAAILYKFLNRYSSEIMIAYDILNTKIYKL